MSNRDLILGKLREAKRPFPTSAPPSSYLPMVPLVDTSLDGLTARFVQEAEKLACSVHQVKDEDAALASIVQIVGRDTDVSAWEPSQLPLQGLVDKLHEVNVGIASPDDPDVQVGITGADAALAATGSIVIMSGNGRYRAPSLLPPIHIAILKQHQILPDMENWWVQMRKQGLDRISAASNVVIISGPSRTADIAMELILGMHGPRELHIILIEDIER